MRINRNMLLKLANDTVDRYVSSDRTLMAVYLQGSLLGASPLIGNTADIDLFFIHNDEVKVERDIVRVSDEVHLDISHHSHSLYRQPRELRLQCPEAVVVGILLPTPLVGFFRAERLGTL